MTTTETQDFTQSFDARDWAAAFVERAKADPTFATDEGNMLGWFANAIMRGYDEHAKETRGGNSLGGETDEADTAWKQRAAFVLGATDHEVTHGDVAAAVVKAAELYPHPEALL